MTAAAVEAAEAAATNVLGSRVDMVTRIEELEQLCDRLEVVELAIEPILPMAVTNVLSEIRQDLAFHVAAASGRVAVPSSSPVPIATHR